MKSSAKRKRRRVEIESEQKAKHEEEKIAEDNVRKLSFLASNNIKPEELPNIVHQNQELIGYIKSKGFADEIGNLKL